MKKFFALMLWIMVLSHPMSLMAEPNQLTEGLWGGEHVSLAITSSGGSLEFDCAHGAFDHQPKLDAQGRFSVTGTYEAEHGGPVRADDQPNVIAVQYLGLVKNGKMTLKVRRVSAKRALGVFTLKLGQEPMLFKCR